MEGEDEKHEEKEQETDVDCRENAKKYMKHSNINHAMKESYTFLERIRDI